MVEEHADDGAETETGKRGGEALVVPRQPWMRRGASSVVSERLG